MKRYFNILAAIVFSIMIIVSCKKSKTSRPSMQIATRKVNNKSQWVAVKSGIKLFDSPGLNGRIVGNIPYGDKLIIIEEEVEETRIEGVTGRWSKVNWSVIEGWVFSGYLMSYEPHDKPEPKKIKPQVRLNSTEHIIVGDWYFSIKGLFENKEISYRKDKTVTFDSFWLGGPPQIFEGTWSCDEAGDNFQVFHDGTTYQYRIIELLPQKITLELKAYKTKTENEIIKKTVIMRRQ